MGNNSVDDPLREWSFTRGSLQRWALNRYLQWHIPFNRPHGLSIETLSDTQVRVRIPNRRRNWNHLHGLHACVLAAGAEFASGVVLLRHVDRRSTRLIMKSLKVDYHYRGENDAFATAVLDPLALQSELHRLEKEPAVVVPLISEVHDRAGNHLATAAVEWQVKPWTRVKGDT